MVKKYNYIHIFIDVIRFKLSIKDIKRFKKISDICDKIEEHKASGLDLISLCKYKPKDFINLIKFHNKYVIGEDNKISIKDLIDKLYANLVKFKMFNNSQIFTLIKDIETIINKN